MTNEQLFDAMLILQIASLLSDFAEMSVLRDARGQYVCSIRTPKHSYAAGSSTVGGAMYQAIHVLMSACDDDETKPLLACRRVLSAALNNRHLRE